MCIICKVWDFQILNSVLCLCRWLQIRSTTLKLDTELKPREETLLAHLRLKNRNIKPNPNLVKEMCLHLIFCSRTTCDSANSSRHILNGFAFILANWKFWWVKNPISATSKTGREKCETNIRSENAILGWEIFEWEGRKKRHVFPTETSVLSVGKMHM